MQKVALVIFPIHSSHGCILQTFALKSILEDFGFHVDIINRHWNKPSLLYRFKFSIKRILNNVFKGGNLPLLWEDACYSFKLRELNSFINQYLSFQVIDIKDEDDFDTIDWNQYHALVVGSDQTWRPKYVSNVYNYFFNFAEQYIYPLKIAYAASFGTDKWEYSEEQTKVVKRLISHFDAVAVREVSGISLCKEFLGSEAIRVLDPTLLFQGEEYIRRLGLKVNSLDVLATFFLDRTKEKCQIADDIAKKLGISVINVNRDIENQFATIQMQVAPSMTEWLETNLAAKFVIVDSFHAMVFAILFHKQFLVIGNIQRGLSRFQSVLDSIGLLDRLYISNSDPISLMNNPIDWDVVDAKLQIQRDISIAYLKDSLSCTKN